MKNLDTRKETNSGASLQWWEERESQPAVSIVFEESDEEFEILESEEDRSLREFQASLQSFKRLNERLGFVDE